jgi:hypothetical protein
MLTLIAYRFAVGTSLPVISYLTRLDYFILGATILVFSSRAEVVVTGYMVRGGHKQWATNVDRLSRLCFPVALAYLMAHSFYVGIASS